MPAVPLTNPTGPVSNEYVSLDEAHPPLDS